MRWYRQLKMTGYFIVPLLSYIHRLSPNPSVTLIWEECFAAHEYLYPGTSQLELCTINPHLHCICLFLTTACIFRAQTSEKPELLLTDDPDKDKYDDTAKSDTAKYDVSSKSIE